MVNMNTGRNGSIGFVVCTLSSDARCLFWKTNVIVPNATPMLRRFIATTFTKMTIEQKTTTSNSSTNPTTTSTKNKNLDASTSLISTVTTVTPPMLTHSGPSRGTTW